VQGFLATVRRLLGFAPRVLALGGGGYDLPNVARAWAGVWAALNEVDLAPELPTACHASMRRLGLEQLTLGDPPAELPAPARAAAEEYAARQVRAVRETIFPVHGI